MKHSCHRAMAVILVSVLLLASAILPAHAETADSLHLYLGIPFDTGTVEMVTDILAKEKGVPFEMDPNGGLCGDAHNVEEFGYLFDIQVDISNGKPQRAYSFVTGEEFTRYPPAIERILLRTNQPGWRDLNEALPYVPATIDQFMDMFHQLTQQYGQPDIQYFTASPEHDHQYKLYLFPDGQWHPDIMRQIVTDDDRLVAVNYWGNVCLKMDIDLGVRYQGVYYADIHLSYHAEDDTEGFYERNTVESYPTNPV
ncbi:MAG: hypothetical protein J6K73_12810 [Clostridia bacterium]|nr:hypothetical protein [Clostridia bacterium]